MLPIFHKRMLAQSGYLFPVAEVDAQIAARLAALTPAPKPEPDLTKPDPAITPHVLEPEKFAEHFLRTHAPPPPKKKAATPKSKKPKLRLIDGGGDKKK
jgi:hypothetical protein